MTQPIRYGHPDCRTLPPAPSRHAPWYRSVGREGWIAIAFLIAGTMLGCLGTLAYVDPPRCVTGTYQGWEGR